jgi:hypothetical protein
MHTQLLNIGFIKQPDGSYFNPEVGLRVTIVGPDTILVPTAKGDIQTTVADLEDAIVSGAFGGGF